MISIDELRQGTDAIPATDEYNLRNYCGRAYYTAYHSVVEHLNQHYDYAKLSKSYYNKMGTHQRLIEFLANSDNPKHLKLSYLIKQMRDIRVKSDYKLEQTVIHQDYLMAQRGLVKVFSLLEVG